MTTTIDATDVTVKGVGLLAVLDALAVDQATDLDALRGDIEAALDAIEARLTALETPAPPPPPARDLLVPTVGAWWGTSPGSGGGNGASSAGLALWEGFAKRKAKIVHVYKANDTWSGIPTADEIKMFAGAIPFYNWKPGGATRTWQSVADGGNDVNIRNCVTNLAKMGPMFLAIQHEPDNDTTGDPDAAAYRAMFRHVVELLRECGADNVVVVWNVTGYSGQAVDAAGSGFSIFYPGDDVVDWIGWNPYQLASILDFDDLMLENAKGLAGWKGFYAWATTPRTGFAGDKPLMLAEWGSWFELNSDAKAATFISAVGTQAPFFPRLKAFVQFNVDIDHQNHIDGHPLASAAYAQVGGLPYFNP